MIDRVKNWAKNRPVDSLEHQFGFYIHNARKRLQTSLSDDGTYLEKMFQEILGYPLNLDDPTTFNEKLQWLKLYYRHPQLNLLVDKMAVRGYVAKVMGEQHLIPLLGVYDSVEEIDRALPSLPDQFVLKANHGSGWNVLVQENRPFGDRERHSIRKWLRQNYYYHLDGREWPYKDVPPKIVCEAFIEPANPNATDIFDYKFFCFDGVVQYVQVDLDRFSQHRRNIYTVNWERLPLGYEYLQADRDVARPSRLLEMIDIAQKLSKGFPFARIDLYTESKIFFGEITLFPGSGFEHFDPIEYDYEFGQHLTLPLE